MAEDIADVIARFNAGRDPERLAMKYRAMRTNAFIFLRGTCHLFYAGLPDVPLLRDAPAAWACGDLHLQNYGSYKGDDRLVYFDINDFDEAALAPCTWDPLRLLTSTLVGAETLGVNGPEAIALCHCFIDAYAVALAEGKSRWLERETATGMIRDLLDALGDRGRKEYLDTRTVSKNKQRLLKCDGRKALPASDEQRQKVTGFVGRATAGEPNPQFFRVLDVARRIAGTGSLGVDRYVILVEGKGSPDQNYLLDLKRALPSCLVPHLRLKQPEWKDEAERVVTVQRRMQAVSQAFLRPVVMDGAAYIFRGLQPSEDRVDLAQWQGKLRRLEDTLADLGRILAWGQLRASGRQGSAIVDELIAFGENPAWRSDLIELARLMALRVEADWKAYCASGLGA
jgi:uncharacterized protein (DUF2252 family)